MSAVETNQLPRIMARLGGAPGPVVVAVGGMHGNEPAGIEALDRVAAQLDAANIPLRGTFLALRGNLPALSRDVRCVDADFNRVWEPEVISGLVSGARSPDRSEDTDLLELHAIIDDTLRGATGDGYLLDLHTTSGDSAPFGTLGDTLRNRAFARHFPIPMILGLEEHLDGTMLEFFNRQGYITLGLEGGRHDDPASVERLEAGLWLALTAAGVLDPANGQATRARTLLQAAGKGLPAVLEVRYRHFVGPEDRFLMRPGFRSFQPVSQGLALADDEAGEVTAPESGLLLMPLYQAIGEDGFFVTREFSTTWLTVSSLLRRLQLDRVLHLLPGVTRDLIDPHTLYIDGRVARWFALEVFHLLGYRKRRRQGEVLVVTRRRETRRNQDPTPPQQQTRIRK